MGAEESVPGRATHNIILSQEKREHKGKHIPETKRVDRI